MRTILFILLVLGVVQSGLACGKGKKKGLKGLGQPPAAEQEPVVQRMIGSGVTTNPYSPGDDSAGDCSKLKCNLDDSQSCSWTNNQPPADELNWVSATGAGDPPKLQTSFGTQESPQGNYFVTASETAGTAEQSAQLYSAPISCANNDITVKLKHWQSKGTKIQVCSVKDPTGQPQNCQDLPATSPGPDTVTIPKDSGIRLVIQAKGFTEPTGTVAVVDDIEVTCDPCPGSTTPPPGSTPPGETPAPSGAPPCKEVKCDFEGGNPCSYQQASGGGNAADAFGAKSAPYQNRLTGVPKPAPDGGQKFGGTYTKKKGEKSTFSTDAPFDKDYVVRYEYYKATEGVKLKGCCDDESKCPQEAATQVQTADYRAWKTASFQCSAGTKKVIFVCENVDGASEGACGIDNIQLLQPSGGDPNSASQSACP